MDHSINHAKNHSANRRKTRPLALITGGSSGIGYALAEEFYARGYDLVLVGRDEKKLRRAAAHLVQKSSKCQRQEDKVNNIYGGRVETVSCDLTRQEECFRLHELYRDRFVEILVNCAGFGVYGQFVETDPQQEMAMMEVNCGAVHLLMKLYLQDMEKRGNGTILNVASSAGLVPGGPCMAAYYATKAYVTSLTQGVAEELRARHSSIRVAALCPGPVDTPFFGKAGIGASAAASTPEAVAKTAMKGLDRGEMVIVPGFGNRLACVSARLLPARVILSINRRIQEKKKR
ncbi:MAG: SDR family oxidoreductase [Lachnospiraceae bacterium]|nr:SDR family oxidoreductase [Lachnospiraceae bacterium]